MDDLHLHLVIVGFTARIPQGKIGIKVSWYATVGNYVIRRANYQRWKSIGFEVASNQTHGLVTNRSQWNEYRYVYFIFH